MAGSSALPPVATARMASTSWSPCGDVVLQEVPVAGRALGQQRDGVLGVVVLREDHDAGARMPLAHLLGRVDALAVERRGHPDVGDEDLGLERGGPLHHLVVVGGDPDDPEVLVPLDEGPDALADDEVVVGQEHRDRARSDRAVVDPSPLVLTHSRRRRTGGDLPGNGGARHTLAMPVTTLVNPGPPVEAGPMTTQHADPPRGARHLAVVDPHRGDRGRPAPGLRLGDHALRPAPTDRGHGRRRSCGTRTASASPTSSGPSSPSTDGRIVDCGYAGRRPDGIDPRQPGRGEAPLPGGAAARHPARARARRRLGPLRPDLRRPHRRPRAAAGAPAALHPVAGAAGVDDAVADAARRRAVGARAHRRQPVPPALGLRRRQPALPQVGPDRLQGLVPQVVRQAQPVG